MHYRNKSFVKFLLARINEFLHKEASDPGPSFKSYMNLKDEGNKFEVEHILPNKFEEHPEFEQRDTFEKYRNRLGALLLLPKGFNQSYGAQPYKQKLENYSGQNSILAKSLHPDYYENNPGIHNFMEKTGLKLKPHKTFKKKDIEERTDLIRKLCSSSTSRTSIINPRQIKIRYSL